MVIDLLEMFELRLTRVITGPDKEFAKNYRYHLKVHKNFLPSIEWPVVIFRGVFCSHSQFLMIFILKFCNGS